MGCGQKALSDECYSLQWTLVVSNELRDSDHRLRQCSTPLSSQAIADGDRGNKTASPFLEQI
ncbi:hypothetical protein L1049_005339 [Liquidambar formosana]|uniref:Uncharacterized protein n=1 Tax=Liquidambar formosana TaxID=63359 RepID=A0AAP0RU57_LIQFO